MPAPGNLLQRFASHVAAHPDRSALLHPEGGLSYRALADHAWHIAARIREASARGSVAMLWSERCPQMVAGLLGIIGSGRTCISQHLTPATTGRTLEILRSHHAPVLVASPTQLRRNGVPPETLGVPLVDLDAEFATAAPSPGAPLQEPAEPGFIIYTSGSTGRPKGVVHAAASIQHNIDWYADTFAIGPTDVSLLLSSCAHIAGVVGILRPLITGGTLFQFDILRGGFPQLAREIEGRGVSVMPVVPSVFRQFCATLAEDQRFPGVRLLIMGGEAVSTGDVRLFRQHFRPGTRLLHTLGCSELPTYRVFPIDHSTELTGSRAPAGYPAAGKRVTIVRSDGSPAAPGEAGEIHISSPDLALGYWDLPEETERRFYLGEDGQRHYRTGDVGRILEGDLLVCEGRSDWQLNLNGIRTEPEEIERGLMGIDGVVAAAIRLWPGADGSEELCAYLVGRRPDLAEHVRREAPRRLPGHVVLRHLVRLSSLPLNQNGKLDRAALPAPETVARAAAAAPPAPSTERSGAVDDRLAVIRGIFRNSLHVPEVGPESDFFELGGDSLKAAVVSAEIEQAFSRHLAPRELFRYRTPTGLRQFLDARDSIDAGSPIVKLRDQGRTRRLYFVHGRGGDVFVFLPLLRHVPETIDCFGVIAAAAEGPGPASLRALAESHAAALAQHQPDGPVALCGYSLGGILAFEIARILAERGRAIAFLGVIDSFIPNLPLSLRLRHLAPFLLVRMRAHFGTLTRTRTKWIPFLRQRMAALRRHFRTDVVPPTGAPVEAAPSPGDPYLRLGSHHTLEPAPVPVDLFWARGNALALPAIWRRYAGAGLRTHRVPGAHLEVLYRIHLDTFGTIFAEALESAKVGTP